MELRTGGAEAAGSVCSGVRMAIRSTSTSGRVEQFAGCHALRQIQPGVQGVPPFRPIFIVSRHLDPVTGPLNDALPSQCP